MINHLFLRTGYVEGNSNSYLYLFHGDGFETREELLKHLFDTFAELISVDGHPFAGNYQFCGTCGKVKSYHDSIDLSEEVGELVKVFASGECDGTGEMWEALQSRGWKTHLEVTRLSRGSILKLEEHGELFVSSGEICLHRFSQGG